MADVTDYVDDLVTNGTAMAGTSIVSSRLSSGTSIRSTTPASVPTTGVTTTELTCSGDVTIAGNLTVNGTTSTVNSTVVTVDDKNIELGSVAAPTDTTADGGGITLKGATDKTIAWQSSDSRWHFNQGANFVGDLYLSPTVISTAHIVASGSLKIQCANNLTIGDTDADSVRIGRTNTAAAKVHIRSGADTDLVVYGSKVGLGTETPAEMLHLKSSSSTKPELLIENTNTNEFSSVLRFYKSTTDEAASDQVGLIIWTGKDAADSDANMAWIVGKAGTVDSGAEEGALHFGVATEGVASYSTLSMVGTGDAGKSYALFGDPWQAAHSTNVGIGVTTPSVALEIDGDIKLSPTASSTAHVTSSGSMAIRADANMFIGDSVADSIRIGRTNTSVVPVYLRSGGDNDLVVKGSKVGINDDSPSHTLDVDGDINLTGGFSFDDGTAVTSIDTDISSVSSSDDTLASAKAIKTYVDAQVTAQDLDFQDDNGNGFNIDLDSEVLIIAGGNGVGTSGSGNTITIATDAAQSHVTSLGTLTSVTVSGDATVGDDLVLNSDDALISFGAGADVTIAHTDDMAGEGLANDHGLVLQTTSARTDTPALNLALKGASSGTPAVGFGASLGFIVETAADNYENAGFIACKATDISSGAEDFKITMGVMSSGSAASDMLTILESGNVGIGKTAPHRPLHVVDSAAASPTYASTPTMILEDATRPGLQIMGSANNIGIIQFGDNSSSNSGEIYYDHSADTFNVRTGGTVRYTLDNSGNFNCTGEVQTAKIAYTDGDDAITIADGGGVTANTSLTLASGSTVTAIKDEDTMSSDSDTALATQQSIKAYVDSVATAADLDLVDSDGNNISLDLDAHSLTFTGTSNEVDVTITGSDDRTITVGLPNDVTIAGDLTVGGGDIVMTTGGTLTFEGSSADAHETTLAVTNPTGDRTITLPDVTGTVLTDGDVLYEAKTGTGVSGNTCSPTIPTTIITANNTATYTLADGSRIGFRKTIITMGSSHDITITPANLIGATSSVINPAGDYIEYMWMGTGWMKVMGNGDVTS